MKNPDGKQPVLTIIIPTMNRSDFLIRLLNYYENAGLEFSILIGDSSDPLHAGKIQAHLARPGNRLNVVYREYTGFTEPRATFQMLREVTTPYVAFTADDDFLTVKGLKNGLKFLESHPDYSVALGEAVIFTLKESGPFGLLKDTGFYHLGCLEASRAEERLLEHLGRYSNPNFGVHRTQQFREAYRRVPELKDKGFTEILPNCVSAIQGKIKRLDGLYLVRQGHDQRYLLPKFHDWVTSASWLPSYQVFENCLSECLAEKERISEENAKEIVKKAFGLFMAKNLRKVSSPGIAVKAKTALKRIPGVGRYLKATVRSATSRIFPSAPMALENLLDGKSPYHADFMPIYHLIQQSPADGGSVKTRLQTVG